MKIKKIIAYLFTIMTITFISCSKNDDENTFEGSTNDLSNFFNEEVVEALDSLSFTINRGGNPPNLEGTFFASPVILTASNVPSDQIGSRIVDFEFSFSNQNNNDNSIDFQGESLSGTTVVETFNGSGSSFISGADNAFSVFSIITGEIVGSGAIADIAYAISGELSNEGIIGFELAIIILDDRGDPTNTIFLEIGQGRKFEDQDQLAELISNGTTASTFKTYVLEKYNGIISKK